MEDKHKKAAQNPMPNVGTMILKVLQEERITKAEVSRRLGVSQPTFTKYLYRDSVQAGILWRLSLALECDFFSEFARHLPDAILELKPLAHREALLEKDREIADLKKEIEIYKALLVQR